MSVPVLTENPALARMVEGLSTDLGDRLEAVVLYGSAARGDFQKATSDLNLLVVLSDLEPPTLAALGPAFRRWKKSGQPLPRVFSAAMIADSADVFPIEFLDIRGSHIVLHGKDPLEGLAIRHDHLRLQCEKELREKMMRLREGYVESHGRPRMVQRLMVDSYPSFAALFRGCLFLLAGGAPPRNQDVVTSFCERAELDVGPFREVALLKQGTGSVGDPEALFTRYYGELAKAVSRVDRFAPRHGGMNP